MAPKKRGRITRALLIVLCVFLVLLLAVMIAGTAYVENKLNLMNRPQETLPTLSAEEIQQIEQEETDPVEEDSTTPTMKPEDIIWTPEPAPIIGGEEETHIINILLIGQDRRAGEYRARSDSMILCTVNTKAKTLTMTSFMRDLYVQIPGYQDTRLNHAYQYNGMPLLDETLKLNFGVQVDGNVEVDFSKFEQVIDLLGGVDIYLSEREAAHLNSNGWTLKEGMNHLNGEQALSYARIRKLDSDFVRTSRQRNVLTALLNQCRNLSFTSLNGLLDQLLPLVTTDLSNAQIISYALELFPMLKDITVVTQRIPADGTYTNARVRGMSVLVPDLEANRQLLKETLMGS